MSVSMVEYKIQRHLLHEGSPTLIYLLIFVEMFKLKNK